MLVDTPSVRCTATSAAVQNEVPHEVRNKKVKVNTDKRFFFVFFVRMADIYKQSFAGNRMAFTYKKQHSMVGKQIRSIKVNMMFKEHPPTAVRMNIFSNQCDSFWKSNRRRHQSSFVFV